MYDHEKRQRKLDWLAKHPNQSLYGGWPLVPLTQGPFKGERTLACPKCKGTSVTLTTEHPPFGTGPNNRWRMGDAGARELALCNSCGEKGYAIQL